MKTSILYETSSFCQNAKTCVSCHTKCNSILYERFGLNEKRQMPRMEILINLKTMEIHKKLKIIYL